MTYLPTYIPTYQPTCLPLVLMTGWLHTWQISCFTRSFSLLDLIVKVLMKKISPSEIETKIFGGALYPFFM